MRFREHMMLLISLLRNLLVPNKDVAMKFLSHRLGSAGTLALYGMTSGGEGSMEISILLVITELPRCLLKENMWIWCWKGERETSSVFSRGKGGIHYFYVHVAVGSNMFNIVNFQRGGGIIHWKGRVAMGSVGAGVRSQMSMLYVVGIIFWPSWGSIGIHICSETIEN